jgi:putative peptidoglycan lipid II flippase
VGGSGQASDGRLASRLFTVAGLLAASAVLSRVLGVGREAILSRLLGVSAEVDAYRAAFFLPDLLFHFLAGGAISVPFIPLYTRARARSEAEAEGVLAVVLGTTTLLAAVATLALWIAADPLVPWIFQEFPPETQQLAVRLTRIVLPAQLCFIAGGVIRGALMARGHFMSQAAAPLVYNLGIIAGGLALGPRLGAEGFAWGTLLGAIVGPLLTAVLEAARAPGVSLRMRVAPAAPVFRAYLLLALPLMLGVSLFVVDEWYDKYFGQFAGAGAMAALGYARLLLQLPVGVIGQALATAALPYLAQLWSEGRREALDALLLDALRAGLALGVLAGAAYLVVAEPIVGLLYQGGRFGPEQTREVATLLRIFALAVPAFVVQQIAVRAFHAREDMWRPMFLGTAVALAAVVLYAELGTRYGAPGLAGAGAIGMSANALATLWLARRLHGAPDLVALATSGLRALAVGVAAGVAAALVPAPGLAGIAGHALHLLLAGSAFTLVALAATFTVGDPPLRAVVARMLRRLRRGGQ